MTRLRRAAFSAGLGLLTWLALGLLKSDLPFSGAKGRFFDAVSLPGAVIASVFYPEGIHTGSGASGWVYTVVVANFLVYAALWYVALTVGKSGKVGDRL